VLIIIFCPGFVSPAGAHHKVVDSSGACVFCDPRNSDAFAEAMMKMILDRDRYSQRAAAFGSKNSWVDAAEEVQRVYRAVF
jgi:hypothetical protein